MSAYSDAATEKIFADLGMTKPAWERALTSPVLYGGGSAAWNWGTLAVDAAITGGEKMGLFSSIGKALKSAVSVAKVVAPYALDFIPGGGVAKTALKMGLNVVSSGGKGATAAASVSAIDEIMAATSAAQKVGGWGIVAEKAAGVRVRPGVGKVLKIGAGTVAAGAGIGMSEAAFADMYARITGKKNTGSSQYVPIQKVQVVAGEGEEFGAASRPQRKYKRRKKAKKVKAKRSSSTRKTKRRQSAAQKAAFKKMQAGLKRYRRAA